LELKEGAVIANRFRLDRMLGRGGMGSVWLAQHIGLDIACAVKFIHADSASNPEARSRFEREARAAAQLKTPNVVQILDYGVFEETPYIAMELLVGEPLSARLQRRGKLEASEAFRIISQIGRALTKAHAAGIVHRDLKPENVFLVPDEEGEIAKVLDFGVAKKTLGLTDSNTKTGALLGTPFYMSPEQAQGTKAVDSRSDVWSLAVLTFRCMTGELPFRSEALGDLLIKIVLQPIPMPSHVARGIAPSFDRWWERAAQRDPDRRFQTAKELVDALAPALGLTQQQIQAPGPSMVAAPPAVGISSSHGGVGGQAASAATATSSWDGAQHPSFSGTQAPSTTPWQRQQVPFSPAPGGGSPGPGGGPAGPGAYPPAGPAARPAGGVPGPQAHQGWGAAPSPAPAAAAYGVQAGQGGQPGFAPATMASGAYAPTAIGQGYGPAAAGAPGAGAPYGASAGGAAGAPGQGQGGGAQLPAPYGAVPAVLSDSGSGPSVAGFATQAAAAARPKRRALIGSVVVVGIMFGVVGSIAVYRGVLGQRAGQGSAHAATVPTSSEAEPAASNRAAEPHDEPAASGTATTAVSAGPVASSSSAPGASATAIAPSSATGKPSPSAASRAKGPATPSTAEPKSTSKGPDFGF